MTFSISFFDTLNLVTPFAVLPIWYLSSLERNKCFEKLGSIIEVSLNLKTKQKLFKYNFSLVCCVRTDEIPHSSGVSEDPVNITSPYSNVRWFSLSLILTLSSTSISSAGLEYTFLYVINFTFPSVKSSFDFPVMPP